MSQVPEDDDHDDADDSVEYVGAEELVELQPGPNADAQAEVERYIGPDLRRLYDVFSYRHAAALLVNSYPEEFAEVERALLSFRISTYDIGIPGGNESEIPKKLSQSLRPAGWVEAQITGDLHVRTQEFDVAFLPTGKVVKTKRPESRQRTLEKFIDGHQIDYVKGPVALDLEWNSKDQTFDRDLYAMRAFHECGLIGAGIMLTRSVSLNPVFKVVPRRDKQGKIVLYDSGPREGTPKPVSGKYGASTTWMGKLLPRLNAGRHGGCPILVFGIRPALIKDWPIGQKQRKS
jgi:hypothetical protein